MLKIHELTKIYRTNEIQTTALNNINLEVGEGEFIAVMGPSGCGKSTLLHVLGLALSDFCSPCNDDSDCTKGNHQIPGSGPGCDFQQCSEKSRADKHSQVLA